MTPCARNLPQHYLGCTCTTAPGALTAEADVVLLIESQDRTEPDEFPSVLGSAPRPAWGTAADPAQLLANAYESAAYWAQKKGADSRNIVHMDVDDLAQEVWLRLNDRTRLEGRTDFNHAYVSQIASNLVATTTRPMTAENRRGLDALRAQIEEYTDERGYGPDTVEIEMMAEEIREDWHDQRHRPSPGFERYLDPDFETTVPLDVIEDRPAQPDALPTPTIAEGFHVNAALDAVDQVDGATRKDARRAAWNAYAEMTGLPFTSRTAPRSLTAARATVPFEAVPAAASQALDQPDNHPVRRALLTPWPDASTAEHEQILEALTGPYGEDLWRSALISARTG